MTTTAKKVVIAIDASEQAEKAFNWYLSTLHRGQNTIILVHVPEALDGVIHVSGKDWEETLAKEKLKLKELGQKYKNIIIENKLSGRFHTEDGNVKPGDILCKVAKEEDADLLVIGTRGMGKVRRTIMGSVSDYVLHHAHCPVAIFRT